MFVLLRAQTLSLSLSLPFYRTAPDFVWKETKQKQRGREKERERNKNSKLFSRFFFFLLLLDFCLFFCSVLPIIFQDKYFFPKESFLLSLQQSNIKQNPTLVFVRCFDSLSIIIFNLSSIPYL